MAAFKGGQKTAESHNIFCKVIRHVYDLLEMSEGQKAKFRRFLRKFLKGAASEAAVLDSRWDGMGRDGTPKDRFGIFLRARLRTSFFELFLLFSEITFKFGDISHEPLIK